MIRQPIRPPKESAGNMAEATHGSKPICDKRMGMKAKPRPDANAISIIEMMIPDSATGVALTRTSVVSVMISGSDIGRTIPQRNAPSYQEIGMSNNL